MNLIKRLTLVIVWIVVVIAATLLFVQALFADEALPEADGRLWWTAEAWIGLGEEPASLTGGDPTEEEPDIDP